MTTRRAATGALGLTVALALLLSPATSAVAAPGDRLPPELVGTSGVFYDLYTELDGAVYALASDGSVERVDGASPEPLGPGFSSVNSLVGFNGALYLASLASDNAFDGVRLDLDGSTTTVLDDGSSTFLGGIGRIGGFADRLYASSSTTSGAITFTTTDGTTWDASPFPSSPDTIQAIVTIGSELYVDGRVSSVRGVYRWTDPTWTLVPGIAGGLTTIRPGDGRLLVGTSEGLYAVTGGTATELDGTVVNPRGIAEFDGEVWWVDDSNELRSIDAEGVRTTHDIGDADRAAGRLFATATTLYYNTSIGQTESTFRIGLEPADDSGGQNGSEGEELAETGAADTAVATGVALIALLVAGGTLLLVSAQRSRRLPVRR